ncbi:hypothetical protein VRZ08_09985 [Rhodopseudomonas sp. G2_2311]|uniref:hypothetical protein n=1 Tax=Rhodopseudomonas sp. G2_2311 TaxID=3114287 RepID=UPI0039C6E777
MLGPALSHLHELLARRREKHEELTPFERALLDELTAAKKFAPPLTKVLQLSRDDRLRSTLRDMPVGGLSDTLDEFHRTFLDLDKSLRTEIELGSGGYTGDDRMQTACDEPNCPNKKRT